eukprot:gene54312-44676_t
MAEALVRFDLDESEALLDAAQVDRGNARTHYCEDRMLLAFRELLANLRIYRPYLPDALFVVDAADFGDGGDVEAWSPKRMSPPRTP